MKNRCRRRREVVLNERDLPRMRAILAMTGISYSFEKMDQSERPRSIPITRTSREAVWAAVPLRRFALHHRKNASILQRFNGFTLLELLMVLCIIAIAFAALIPAVTSLEKSGGRRATLNSLLGGIEQARAEAI